MPGFSANRPLGKEFAVKNSGYLTSGPGNASGSGAIFSKSLPKSQLLLISPGR